MNNENTTPLNYEAIGTNMLAVSEEEVLTLPLGGIAAYERDISAKSYTKNEALALGLDLDKVLLRPEPRQRPEESQ